MSKNRIIGIILGLVSLLYLYMTSQLPVSRYSTAIGPRVFPYIAAGGLLLCAIGLVFKKETAREKSKGPFLSREGWIRVLKLSVLLALFPLLFKFFGFLVAAVFLLYTMITLFDLEHGESFRKKAMVTLSVTAALYLLFIYVIKIQLPRGDLIEWLIY